MTTVSVPRSTLSPDISTMPVSAISRIAFWADRVGFVLLLLTVATLLIRPADLLPLLGGAPIYEGLVVACIIVSLPRLTRQLALRSLRENSITALSLMLIPAVILSHLVHANTYDARLGGMEMVKACLFFLLVVGIVNSSRRLRWMLWLLTACVVIQALLAVLQYKGFLHLAALESVQQTMFNPDTDDAEVLIRICGIGVFNDPNDFALILIIAMVVCGYGLGGARTFWKRLLLLAPMSLLGYALFLTQSRGGAMAAVAAVIVFLTSRFGWRNMVPLAILTLPILAMSFSGRQTQVDLENPEDTFQTRLDLWNQSLDIFRSAPLFGIGQGKLSEEIGHVTHNSYLHAYAELGLLGGTAFIGMFYLTMRGVSRAAPSEQSLSRLRPYILAIVASYAVGLLSLSRCYTVPTQLILALGAAFLVLSARRSRSTLPPLDVPCIARVFGVGILLLLATLVFLRVMIQGGQT